jgi:methyl-accepting chemotaxis protein
MEDPMNGLFAPGMALMRRLNYYAKFYLLGGVFLCFTFYAYLVVHDHFQELASIRQESAGLRYFEPLRNLLQIAQRHYDMTGLLVVGNEASRSKVIGLNRELDREVAVVLGQLDQLDKELGKGLETGGAWADLRRQWENIEGEFDKVSPEQSLKSHQKFMDDLNDFIENLGSNSQLILDPTLDAYHLIVILIGQYPDLLDAVGGLQAEGAGILAKGKITPEVQTRLDGYARDIADPLRSIGNGLRHVYGINAKAQNSIQPLFDETISAIQQLNRQIDQVKQRVEGKSAAGPVDNAAVSGFHDQAAAEIQRVYAFGEGVTKVVSDNLKERTDRLIRTIWIQCTGVIVIFLTVIYLFVSIIKVVNYSVQGMDWFASELADGNLSIELEDPSQDELGHAAASFNKAIKSLRGLMKELKASSSQLATSTHSLASVTEQTRGNMLRQQGETDQVASAMEELSATAEHIAVSADEAAAAAGKANQESGDGKRVVEQTIGIIHSLASDVENTAHVVQKLSEDSASINVVLDVIRDIAEQTNLLALNAAIEAARAGEQGRGFAVVADEVRTLASRTQQSTQKIRDSIEQLQAGTQNAVAAMTNSRNQARLCVEQAGAARNSLDSIAFSVSRINDMNAQIGSATEEQSQTVASVTQNISSVTQLGFETVNGAKEASALGQQLTELAARLESQISKFSI